jgi:hypothetical protein
MVQLPHWAVPWMQAHVGVAPHPAGRSRHAYVVKLLAAPPDLVSQYWVPCIQKTMPHLNVPDGVGHPLIGCVSTRPDPLASHSFM